MLVLTPAVQFVHVFCGFAPVHTRPSASVAAVVAGARSCLVGSVRSFQLLETSTLSSARYTGTVVGIAYLAAIKAMLSPAFTYKIACTLPLLHWRDVGRSP